MVIPASGFRQYSPEDFNMHEQADVTIEQPRQLDGNVVMVGGIKRIYGVCVLGTKGRWSLSKALPGAVALPR